MPARHLFMFLGIAAVCVIMGVVFYEIHKNSGKGGECNSDCANALRIYKSKFDFGFESKAECDGARASVVNICHNSKCGSIPNCPTNFEGKCCQNVSKDWGCSQVISKARCDLLNNGAGSNVCAWKSDGNCGGDCPQNCKDLASKYNNTSDSQLCSVGTAQCKKNREAAETKLKDSTCSQCDLTLKGSPCDNCGDVAQAFGVCSDASSSTQAACSDNSNTWTDGTKIPYLTNICMDPNNYDLGSNCIAAGDQGVCEAQTAHDNVKCKWYGTNNIGTPRCIAISSPAGNVQDKCTKSSSLDDCSNQDCQWISDGPQFGKCLTDSTKARKWACLDDSANFIKERSEAKKVWKHGTGIFKCLSTGDNNGYCLDPRNLNFGGPCIVSNNKTDCHRKMAHADSGTNCRWYGDDDAITPAWCEPMSGIGCKEGKCTTDCKGCTCEGCQRIGNWNDA